MRVQVIAIDKLTRKYCKVYLWSVFHVNKSIIFQIGRKYPTYSKQYFVNNPKSSTGQTMLYWYEVQELPEDNKTQPLTGADNN